MVWNVTPPSGRCGRRGKGGAAVRGTGCRLAAVPSRPQCPVGAGHPGGPSQWPPNRSGRLCAARRRYGRARWLFRAPSPDGSHQPFFFLGGPTHLRLLARTKRTDLFIEGNEFLAECLEAMKLTDLLLCLTTGGRGRKGFRDSFAGHAAGKPELWTMSRIVGF